MTESQANDRLKRAWTALQSFACRHSSESWNLVRSGVCNAKRGHVREGAQSREAHVGGYVEKGPYEFFSLPEIVDEVQRGFAKNLVNHGRLYCP